jgi:hypothetical protein
MTTSPGSMPESGGTVGMQEAASASGSLIHTSYERKCIPDYDWLAWVDGEEEKGPRGNGRTEVEAMHDLAEQLAVLWMEGRPLMDAASSGSLFAGWRGTHPRSGAPEICAHTPSPSVLRDFAMRPLVYGDVNVPRLLQSLLWEEHLECCGSPDVQDHGPFGAREVCCGRPEPAMLTDAQIVASLRAHFPDNGLKSDAAAQDVAGASGTGS